MVRWGGVRVGEGRSRPVVRDRQQPNSSPRRSSHAIAVMADLELASTGMFFAAGCQPEARGALARATDGLRIVALAATEVHLRCCAATVDNLRVIHRRAGLD